MSGRGVVVAEHIELVISQLAGRLVDHPHGFLMVPEGIIPDEGTQRRLREKTGFKGQFERQRRYSVVALSAKEASLLAGPRRGSTGPVIAFLPGGAPT